MKVKAEYIWIDGDGATRSKTRIINMQEYRAFENLNISHIPEWNYDGSSTKQAVGDSSEVIIKPVSLYKDPFANKDMETVYTAILVLCETFDLEGTPLPTNTRHNAVKLFAQKLELEPMYGIEQEFFISNNGHPIGFPLNGLFPASQGDYYCGAGGDNVVGRRFIDVAFVG